MRKYERSLDFCARAIYITYSIVIGLALISAPSVWSQGQSIPALIQALRDPQPDVRLSAEKKLIKVGPQAVRDLLGEMSTQRQLGILIEALKSSDQDIRAYAAGALRKIGA